MVKKILIALVLSVLMLMTSIAIGLGIIHLTDFIYLIDIEALDIPANSGYSRDTVVENYNAVMDYLDPFNTDDFSLPSMAYSDVGAIHFEDCKVIFTNLYIWGAVSFILLTLMLVFLRRDKLTCRLAGILTLVLPTVVGIAMAVSFDRAFVIFHKLLFNDMNWIFDPFYDPIITILPEAFFMHCGIFIALCVVLGSVILFLGGRRNNEKL